MDTFSHKISRVYSISFICFTRSFICSFPYRLEGGQWYMRFHILFIHQTIPDVIPSFIHWHIKSAGCPAHWPPLHICFHAFKVIAGLTSMKRQENCYLGRDVGGGGNRTSVIKILIAWLQIENNIQVENWHSTVPQNYCFPLTLQTGLHASDLECAGSE